MDDLLNELSGMYPQRSGNDLSERCAYGVGKDALSKKDTSCCNSGE